jgi:DNA polymerase-1
MAGRFFIVDGTALAYRAHFALINRPLTTSKGFPTSAIFGYLATLLKILREQKPDFMAVAFDRPEPTFRHARYPEYKATRDKAPDEMVTQLPAIKELTEALGIPVLELAGYEADDIIGTVVRRAEKEGLETFIVCGDKDMMQLVGPTVRILDVSKPGRGEAAIIDEKGVEAKFGVPPGKVIDVLGLMGDSSDNVPGVPMVGPKKATELVLRWGSLEGALEGAPRDKPGKVRDNLVAFADQARLSKELVTIHCSVPIDLPFERLHPGRRDTKRLIERLTEFEFSNLLKEVASDAGEQASQEGYRIARSEGEIEALLGELRKARFFVFDTETTGLDPRSSELVGLAFSMKEKEAWYVPCHRRPEVLGRFRPLLEDPALGKGGQNCKFDMEVLRAHGVAVAPVTFDTMLASYLLEPGRGTHNLDAMALRHLGVRKIPTEELIGKGKNQITMAEVPVEKVAAYAAEDADCTFRLVQFFRPRLAEEGLETLFREIEMPLVPVLVDMEMEGVKVDVDYLRTMSAELEETAGRLAAEIQALAGEAFNVNSPKQLGPILFDRLQIQKGSRRRVRRTQTGYSTDAAVLEEYSSHPIVGKILEYREVTKLRSTYVDALPALVHPKTGRIHSSFHQAVAATGRLSSSDPNLQNIPIRTELGKRIRRSFVARDGFKLVGADYNQIELRLMAHLSGDKGLRDVYARGGDVHAETAARIFDIPPAKVTRDQRSGAKAINFGILYGMGPTRLARDLKISMEESKAFLEAYFREFPRVRDYQRETIEKARRDGFVETLFGRRRAIPEILSEDPGVRVNAENMALNTPLQGTAADLIKVAMIRIHERLGREFPRSKMILQVHDELLFESPAGEAEKVARLVKAEMEGAKTLDVPIVADTGIGDNWLEAH